MREWWWLWSRCPGIGVVWMRALEEAARDQGVGLDALWGWPITQLRDLLAWPPSIFDRLDHYRRHCGDPPSLIVPDDVLLPGDRSWPRSLDRLNRPPLGLFYRGRHDLLDIVSTRQAVAVVGTRAASSHGLGMAEELGSMLAGAGWPVLSGLAEGIDGAAHRGVLAAGGAPLAVLGTPLDRAYPRHHAPLQDRIAHSGLLLTEQAPGTSVQRSAFAERNRLLVAFACAVVVVECPERSGALITARLAKELQCPLWVVPGDVNRWSTRGSNALLQHQASPLLCARDLVHQLGPGPLRRMGASLESQQEPHSVNRQGRDSLAMLKRMGDGTTVHDLAVALHRSEACVATDLVQLEVEGHVLCESGFRWRPVRG